MYQKLPLNAAGVDIVTFHLYSLSPQPDSYEQNLT